MARTEQHWLLAHTIAVSCNELPVLAFTGRAFAMTICTMPVRVGPGVLGMYGMITFASHLQVTCDGLRVDSVGRQG